MQQGQCRAAQIQQHHPAGRCGGQEDNDGGGRAAGSPLGTRRRALRVENVEVLPLGQLEEDLWGREGGPQRCREGWVLALGMEGHPEEHTPLGAHQLARVGTWGGGAREKSGRESEAEITMAEWRTSPEGSRRSCPSRPVPPLTDIIIHSPYAADILP